MDFYEKELRKLTDMAGGLDNEKHVGRACFGTLSDNLRVRVEFVTTGIMGTYDAIKATVINKNDGPVDSLTMRFSDVLGVKAVGNPNYKGGVVPCICLYNNKLDWYLYKPTPADYEKLAGALNDYLDVFRDMEQGMSQGGQTQEMQGM